MEKQFIPYEEALALKELGFNELCFAQYVANDKTHPVELKVGYGDTLNAKYVKAKATRLCTAPLYQQAFDWLRKNYTLRGFVVWGSEYIALAKYQDASGGEYYINDFTTDEDARLACLQKLIELAKEYPVE